jgi:hypothetical protein
VAFGQARHPFSDGLRASAVMGGPQLIDFDPVGLGEGGRVDAVDWISHDHIPDQLAAFNKYRLGFLKSENYVHDEDDA